MIAYERIVASDGYEVALFPLPYLYMTQDEGGDYSHVGTYNIDFIGYGASGRIYEAPIYAPCTMKVVAVWMTYQAGNRVVFESVDKVHLANGQLDYLTISFAHDSNPPVRVIGQVVQMGEICYRTGQYGEVTGDHVHTCVGQGRYEGFTTREGGHEDLTNRIHYWDGVYVNDTFIIQGYNHNWIEWSEPTKREKSRFPWVLYGRKLRDRRTI